MSLEAGMVLARSYRLLHPIGEGGMGRVWVAEHLALERRVAIKVLSDEVINSDIGLDLFNREARATARIDHPHVVRVLDFDVTDDGTPFLVLELLVGETLENRLLRVGALPVEEVRAILEQTCQALAVAHGLGFLHRDIKAENLFMCESRLPVDVKLLDFGIALCKTAPPTRATGVVGTVQYISPEQMMCADVDERADLFSLGICAYYALTGVFPFVGDTVPEMTLSLARGSFVPVTQLRPELPHALDDWFLRSLATSRDSRFRSTHEMYDAFHAALRPRHDTPVAVAIEVAHHAPPPPRRIWKTVAAACALATLFVVGYAKLTPHAAFAAPANMATAIHPEPPAPPALTAALETQTPTPTLTQTPPPTLTPTPTPTHTPTPTPTRTHHTSPTLTATASATTARAILPPPVADPEIPGTEGFGPRQ